MPPNDLYITKMSTQDFNDKFSDRVLRMGSYEGGPLRRLGIVLPFSIDNGNGKYIVPIPFIIDTGAPIPVYLGEAAFDFFENNDLIIDVCNQPGMLLKGSFKVRERERV